VLKHEKESNTSIANTLLAIQTKIFLK
jgi:hypothetical protein